MIFAIDVLILEVNTPIQARESFAEEMTSRGFVAHVQGSPWTIDLEHGTQNDAAQFVYTAAAGAKVQIDQLTWAKRALHFS